MPGGVLLSQGQCPNYHGRWGLHDVGQFGVATGRSVLSRTSLPFFMFFLLFHLSSKQLFSLKKTPEIMFLLRGSLFAWRRPTLAGAMPQLPWALESLTAVFGMGTGVTFPLLPPDLNFKGCTFKTR